LELREAFILGREHERRMRRGTAYLLTALLLVLVVAVVTQLVVNR